jgi:hypothetical protein
LKNEEEKISFLWSADLNKKLRLRGGDFIEGLLVKKYRKEKLLKKSVLMRIR